MTFVGVGTVFSPRSHRHVEHPVGNRDSASAHSGEWMTEQLMKKSTLILWELLLLFSSILVFRSVWLLLDKMAWASANAGLLVLLGIGSVLTMLALKAINR
jgi:hypothetical protein